ncbi:MAG: 5-formyltetrahydrofolate cyclo-ligase [Boseongicola sp.]|nr:5-formyltetrahydrofolate cyclo-ligase [Boseongicola sp.]
MNSEMRAKASAAITRHLLECACFRNADVIGAYLAFNNEVDLQALIERAHADQKKVFVPVITEDRRNMLFARLRPGAHLQLNHFGIAEPESRNREFLEARELHSVFVPVVAFDSSGNRLGMGAGFYDRAFAFRRNPGAARFPKLCGVAFDCQRVSKIEHKKWDVPLDLIATENGVDDVQRKGIEG